VYLANNYLNMGIIYSSPKNQNSSTTFSIILLTDKPTNTKKLKHNFLSGDKNRDILQCQILTAMMMTTRSKATNKQNNKQTYLPNSQNVRRTRNAGSSRAHWSLVSTENKHEMKAVNDTMLC